MSNTEIMKNALQRYGKDKLIDMCIEEMSELTKELLKNRRGADNENNILKEVVDVLITLNYLNLIFKFDPKKIEFTENQKLQRLKKQIEQEVNDYENKKSNCFVQSK